MQIIEKNKMEHLVIDVGDIVKYKGLGHHLVAYDKNDEEFPYLVIRLIDGIVVDSYTGLNWLRSECELINKSMNTTLILEVV